MGQHVEQIEFPAEQAKNIAAAVISKNFTSALLDDAWIVAEYAKNIVFPPGTPAKTALFGQAPGIPAQVDQDAAMQQLLDAVEEAEHHVKKGQHKAIMALPPLPWATILKTILTLILSVLP